MKAYTKPEIEINKFDNKDSILLVSNGTQQTRAELKNYGTWSQLN